MFCKHTVNLALVLGLVGILGNISVSAVAQVGIPDLRTLGQLVRQNFKGYGPQNTRTYTLFGNGNSQMFPLDHNAGLPIPKNMVGPIRSVMAAVPSGSPFNYGDRSSAEAPSWQPSNVNPYSYMQGHQGRADFSHEVEEEGDIITVDDLKVEPEVGDVEREIKIESTMSFN